MQKVNCPNCNTECKLQFSGKLIECSNCKNKFDPIDSLSLRKQIIKGCMDILVIFIDVVCMLVIAYINRTELLKAIMKAIDYGDYIVHFIEIMLVVVLYRSGLYLTRYIFFKK